MKKIYFLMYTLTLLCLSTFAQIPETKTSPTVIIQTVSSANIGNITVNINMSGFYNNVGSFQWTIKFDSTILQYQSTTNWISGVSGTTIQQPTSGKLTMVWGEPSPVLVNGVLCTLNFNYLGTPTCTDIKFSDSPTPREISDANNVYPGVNYINGQVCQNTVGIEEQSSINKTSVYPNPSNGSFAIRLPSDREISKIEIFNNLGIKVYDSKISSGSNLVNLNLRLSSGIYNIRVSGQEFSDSDFIIIN